ncbi:MAG TPA: DNA gyrase inhibitor YacG [Stellaceae bacterium]|nr:DNA gyrase inhibitor YacG [Stellaceae bacterium]
MDQDPPIPEPRPCPRCGKPAAPRHRPFCSARCRDLDLGAWLNGNYRIAADDPDDEQIGEDEE